jgi:hypothetical protein
LISLASSLRAYTDDDDDEDDDDEEGDDVLNRAGALAGIGV